MLAWGKKVICRGHFYVEQAVSAEVCLWLCASVNYVTKSTIEKNKETTKVIRSLESKLYIHNQTAEKIDVRHACVMCYVIRRMICSKTKCLPLGSNLWPSHEVEENKIFPCDPLYLILIQLGGYALKDQNLRVALARTLSW